MTQEGIIQKVFRTNIQLAESLLERDNKDLVTTWIKAIEQELIKEIELDITSIAFHSDCKFYAPIASYQKACKDIRLKLIGETKE